MESGRSHLGRSGILLLGIRQSASNAAGEGTGEETFLGV
jgi:hypothetical protein